MVTISNTSQWRRRRRTSTTTRWRSLNSFIFKRRWKNQVLLGLLLLSLLLMLAVIIQRLMRDDSSSSLSLFSTEFVLTEFSGNPKGQNAMTAAQITYQDDTYDEKLDIAANRKASSSTKTNVGTRITYPNWRPSHEWLRNCSLQDTKSKPSSTHNSSTSGQIRFSQSSISFWNNTRSVAIGDCIKFCRCFVTKHPPTSFNALYGTSDACMIYTSSANNNNNDRSNDFLGGVRHEIGQHRLTPRDGPGGNLTLIDMIHQRQAVQHSSSFIDTDSLHSSYNADYDRIVFEKPEPYAVVVHLRLGDVVEKSPASVAEILIQGAGPGYNDRNYVRALKSVGEILDNLQSHYDKSLHTSNDSSSHDPLANNEDSTNFGRPPTPPRMVVRIIGGNHRPRFYVKSRVYAKCVYKAIQTAGYETTLQIEGRDPDLDFYYVSHARQLIVSAGSFSNLMGQLVEYRGGTVLGRKFGIDWN